MTKLTVDECLTGMEATMRNGKRLIEDGTLLEKEKSPSAVFLYAIAIEELSKAYTLGIAAIATLEEADLDWGKFWKGFRDHKFKQTGLLKMVLHAQKLVEHDFDDIKKKRPDILFMYKTRQDVSKQIKKLTNDLNQIKKGEMELLKWRHLYVDYSKGQWEIPKTETDEGFLSKHNIRVYLTDLARMKSDIEEEIKKREIANEP